MSASRIELTDVNVAYGSRLVLDAVTFGVPASCMVGVIGPNGAGKTTLFRAILGLAHHTGTVVSDERPSYVPQGGSIADDFPATARDVVMMGRYHARRWWQRLSRDDRRAADDALEQVGMSDHGGCTFGELSGGQRQRVVLARALAHGSGILLLDEPLTGVDTASAAIIDEAMANLRDQGATLLVATHDINEAAERCDRLLFLNGRVIAYGTPAETFTPETLAATYDGRLLIGRDPDGTLRVFDDGAHHHHDHDAHGHDHPEHG